MTRLRKLLALEEDIRQAMLGLSPESRIPLRNLHNKVAQEIKAVESTLGL